MNSLNSDNVSNSRGHVCDIIVECSCACCPRRGIREMSVDLAALTTHIQSRRFMTRPRFLVYESEITNPCERSDELDEERG